MAQKLIKLMAWRKKRFGEGKEGPSERTVRNWANNGEIPAVRRGGLWFIAEDAELELTGNPLVDDILRAG